MRIIFLEALRDLLSRYRQVYRAAWAMRRELVPVERNAHELSFLPAALELQDSPPHPAARVAILALISFVLIATLWACFGKVDIVASAPGKLVVSDRSKVIQSLEPGVIKAIYVQDGQLVKAGQVLIELDATLTGAENNKSYSLWQDAKLEALRAHALLNALETQRLPELAQDPELNQQSSGPQVVVDKLADTGRMALSQWQELQAKVATLEADTSRKRAERAGIIEQVHKLEKTLPFINRRAADYRKLAEQRYVAEHDYLEKELVSIETERDLATQRQKQEELTQAILTNQKQKEATLAEFRRIQHDSLAHANEKIREFAQEVIKAQQRQRQTMLIAPVDGVVQQLAVHTVGGVATAAQPLLVVVPLEDSVEAEAMLENKDIGFVNPGQDAAVKIETFNYTKYGLIDGKVQTVSLDAIQDEKRGLIYAMRVRLARSAMNIEGKQVQLAPGMAITVEIKTGKRRIIEYFLSPLIQYASEGLRER